MSTRQYVAVLLLVLSILGIYLRLYLLSVSPYTQQLIPTTVDKEYSLNIVEKGPYTRVNDVDHNKARQLQQSVKLGNLVQRRLEYLQNPKDCQKAKKIICTFESICVTGFGCLLHFLTHCLIMAYGTGRTLIMDRTGWNYKQEWHVFFQPFSNNCTEYNKTDIKSWGRGDIDKAQVLKIPNIHLLKPRPDFLPFAVPEDLADRLQRFHGNPAVWWLGQFLKFITRPQEDFLKSLKEKEDELLFKGPIVGVHIRRTDKLIWEAKYHSVDDYMQHVEKWFNTYEERNPGVERRVYLATDDPAVLKEAQQKYSNYMFISDRDIAEVAKSVRNRFSGAALRGIITDIHFLSLCDFLVVTLSSNVGRVAYILMQTMHGDASRYAKSLDHLFHFFGSQPHNVTVIDDYSPVSGKDELELRHGDVITLAAESRGGDYWSGTNCRTGITGLFPSNKTKDTVLIAKMPTYPEVKDDDKDNNDV